VQSSRRSVLRLSGTALAGGLAGCASFSSDTDQSASPTATTQPRTDAEPDLAFTAEAVSQQSADSPAEVAAALTNEGTEVVTVGLGPALLFSDTGPGEPTEWAHELVVDPETYVGPWSDPVQTDDGCWRFPFDGEQTILSSLEHHELDPGDAVTERYRVYTDGTGSTCLREGSYRYEDVAAVVDQPVSFTYALVLHVDGDRTLSASTDGPEFTEE
jgi:hypothetical protein